MQILDGTVEGGAGCSHGVAGTTNTLFRVNTDGSITPVADLSALVQTHPIAIPDADDFEPAGTWYGFVAVRGDSYVTEPNHQELDCITPDGHNSRVGDLPTRIVPPASWQGPTGIVCHGTICIGMLGTFPVRPDRQTLYTVPPSGQVAAGGTATCQVSPQSWTTSGVTYHAMLHLTFPQGGQQPDIALTYFLQSLCQPGPR